ncbi:MAG: endonuclease/exonuclease/phosphatase family protein [Candidatus Cryptobacteroides sp.]
MNRLTKIAAAVVLALSPAALPAFGTDADTLKIMTYNLRFGELASMEEIGSYIASESPDIVALQECDWATYRERAPHQNGVRFLNELAWRTGMFGAYGKSINYKGGYYGIALLSRYPILKVERTALPKKDKTEQRSMLAADIELPDGSVVTFVCTHLEVSSSEDRQIQVKFINKKLGGISNPVILAGDMNSKPDSPEMAFLRSKGWTDLTDRKPTYHTSAPADKIDYIYIRYSGKTELLGTGVKEGVLLSDHFPVVSDIVIH